MIKYFWEPIITLFFSLFCLLTPVQAAEFNEDEVNLTMALLSMSSYNDELNLLTRQHLMDTGWQYQSDETVNKSAEGRYHLISRTLNDGKKFFVLAFPGTERKKDAQVDLRLQRVVFGGKNPREFQTIANDTSEKSAAKPLVHSGFNDYIQTALFTKQIPELDNLTAGEAIVRELQAHPDETLYLTGHSLGGAVATLAAARFADMGVQPKQLQVITFGAPAVGNETFARIYENKMQLTRITMAGDPVKSALQSYSKGYVQFGKKIVWRQQTGLDRFEHEMVTYLDQAIRNYQDSRSENGASSSLLTTAPKEVNGGILVAPITTNLSDKLQGNAKYIQATLKEALQANYTPLHFSEQMNLSSLQKEAKQNGDAHILLLKADGMRLKNEKYDYQISLTEELYDTEGNLEHMQVRSMTTKNLTPIEAGLYLYYTGADERDEVLLTNK